MSLLHKEYEVNNVIHTVWICISKNEEFWFKGNEVANILGYVRGTKAIMDHVSSTDKFILSELGINREQLPPNWHPATIFINESGLYSLILRSKLPNAQKFKHWVTSEVLPSIRSTGEYKVSQCNSNDSASASAIFSLIKQMQESQAKKDREQADKDRVQAEKDAKLINSLQVKDMVISKILTSLNDKVKIQKESEIKHEERMNELSKKHEQTIALVLDSKNKEIETKNEEFKCILEKVSSELCLKNVQISDLTQRAVTFPENSKLDPYLCILEKCDDDGAELYTVSGQRDYVRKISRVQTEENSARIKYLGKRPNPSLDWTNITEQAKNEGDLIVKNKRIKFENTDKLDEFTKSRLEPYFGNCQTLAIINSDC